MSKSNCTPGPWYAMTGDTGGIIDQANVFSEHETDGEPTFIADTMGIDDEVPLEERKANARLIAASRGMLDLLKLILSGIERKKIPDQSILRRFGEEVETEGLSNRIRAIVGGVEGAAVTSQERREP